MLDVGCGKTLPEPPAMTIQANAAKLATDEFVTVFECTLVTQRDAGHLSIGTFRAATSRNQFPFLPHCLDVRRARIARIYPFADIQTRPLRALQSRLERRADAGAWH